MAGLPSGAGGAAPELPRYEGDQVGDGIQVLGNHFVILDPDAVSAFDVRDQLEHPGGVHDPGLEEGAGIGHARSISAEKEIGLHEGANVVAGGSRVETNHARRTPSSSVFL